MHYFVGEVRHFSPALTTFVWKVIERWGWWQNDCSGPRNSEKIHTNEKLVWIHVKIHYNFYFFYIVNFKNVYLWTEIISKDRASEQSTFFSHYLTLYLQSLGLEELPSNGPFPAEI